MTRRIAVALSKGGVGKTTTAVNLAAALSLTKRRVLLVDTDTQGQCAPALGIEAGPGLAGFMLGQQSFEDAIIPARENLDLLPGGPHLADIKNQIARADMRPEETLSSALSPHVNGYDYVIIDGGPGWDALAINVLFFAGEILAPVNLEMMAVSGLLSFLERIAAVKKYHDVILRYVLPTALDRRVKQTDEITSQLNGHFSGLMCDPIRYNVRLSEAYGHGQHIFEYAPDSNGAADYLSLTKRVIDHE